MTNDTLLDLQYNVDQMGIRNRMWRIKGSGTRGREREYLKLWGSRVAWEGAEWTGMTEKQLGVQGMVIT